MKTVHQFTPDELAKCLFTAVNAGDRTLVKLVLASGASPDAQQREWPVITLAASRGYTEIVSDGTTTACSPCT